MPTELLYVFIVVCVIFIIYCIYRAIKASRPSKPSDNDYKNLEYKMKCNTCGHIWCFNNSDLGKSAAVNAVNGLSQLSSAATGNILHMAATNSLTNANKAPETSFDKCPKCGSKDVGVYYGGYQAEKTSTSSNHKYNENEDDNENANDKKTDNKVVSDDEIIDEQLRRYKKLLDDNVITQEEFDAKKKELLGL